MVLYIAISELPPSQNDGDPRDQSMVSLTLLDPNRSGLRPPQSESVPSFTVSLPRNSLKILDPVESDVSSPTPVLLPELFLRMYYKFRDMDDDSLRKLEQALLDDRSVTNSGRRFPQWLERVRKILEQRFAEPCKVSEIAAEAGVHPVHLAREFRKHYGTSVGEYLRRVRIEYACRELMGSDAAVTNIAFAAGFADQSHFSRTFKRLCGTTPGRYRASVVRP
jgi:AraC-like DNA-binding protein